MTFTFTNYAAIPAQPSAMHDLIGQFMRGYNAVGQSRAQKEALRRAMLENQYYGPNMESQIGLRGAQQGQATANTGLIGEHTRGAHIANQYAPQKNQALLRAAEFKANNPLLDMTGTAGQIGSLLYLQQHPELMKQNPMENGEGAQNGSQEIPNPQDLLLQSIRNSLNPKQKQYAPSNIGKLQQEYSDVQAGFYPGTNRTKKFESDQMKEEVAAPYREKLGGLKTGEHYLFDPETHEKIGIQRPYTQKEREVETGRAFFNDIFPPIRNGFKDFIGKDSVKNFMGYANNYGKDANATKKIDDLLLAQKLISAGVVNEAATLGAGKTNMTYRNLLKSFPGSDIPNLIERYGKELKLPTDAFLKANIRFQNMINHASEKSVKSVPALKSIHYHPEKYLKSDEQKQEALKEHHETITVRNKRTGQTETISKAEARKRGIKNV